MGDAERALSGPDKTKAWLSERLDSDEAREWLAAGLANGIDVEGLIDSLGAVSALYQQERRNVEEIAKDAAKLRGRMAKAAFMLDPAHPARALLLGDE